MVKKSLWLDVAPKKGQAVASQNATATTGNESGGWNTGTVLEIYPDSQAVRVRIPASAREGEGVEQTGPSDGLVTAVGATVVVLLDGSGRITQVVSPRVIPEGVEPVATGAAGARLLEAMSEAKEAQARADGVRARAQEAFDKAEEAKATADGFNARIGAVESDASNALSKANGVDAKASQAQSLASSAQTTASKALSKAASADGRYTSADHNPLTPEGAGKPVGALWDVVSGGVIVRRFTWTGTAWQQVKIGADTIGKDAVTAEAVYASKEMWSKLAVFDEAVIDKLVAQNATIPGSMIAETLVGKKIVGSDITVEEIISQETYQVPLNSAAGWKLSDTIVRLRPTSEGLLLEFNLQHPVYEAYYSASKAFPENTLNMFGRANIVAHVSKDPDTHFGLTYVDSKGIGGMVSFIGANSSIELPPDIRITSATFGGKVKNGVAPPVRLRSLSFTVGRANDKKIRLYRDGSGKPFIEMAGGTSVATLSPDELTVRTKSGSVIGSQSWRTLVAPPIAYCRWAGNTLPYSTLEGGGEKMMSLSLCKEKVLLNGFAESGGWLIAPLTGWYQITAVTDWSYTSTKDGWAVSTGMRRKSLDRVNWNSDPSDTRSFQANVNIRPTAVGLMKLTKGESFAPAFWQNTGTWCPTGTSFISVQYVASA
ncbi:MAG: hypothetical protein E6845_18925 [Clostridium sp.]|uniref:hypothetical protein n=1 Tax=Clostridium sp. TaxID=1506 RepID=UPI0028FDF0B9|nr:hypothetical protein [Clostridium sp.]MDU1605032.1 hypothetical protein [Clostridium sp.]